MPIHLSQHHRVTCSDCCRRISNHKPFTVCNICSNHYHPKCAKLTPSDVNSLKSANLYSSWVCYHCAASIFPMIADTWPNTINLKCKTTPHREQCSTCLKIGNILDTCELCNCKSHRRCFAGDLGCKKCARDIYPGYDVNFNELFLLTGNNNTRFNPFSYDSDINNLGFSDIFEDGTEQEAWSSCSQLLNSCKYYEPTEIKKSRSTELKIFSLNIRSLKDKVPELVSNIEHFSKFDVLCFNETNCLPEKLPFSGNELELEYFHPPIVQNPARDSGRGGGLIFYLNKNFCSANDFKVLSHLSDRSDPSKGEFLFIEIDRIGKNIILGNMYRSPSGEPNSFIIELENKFNILKRHSNKHIVLVSDSNIDLLKFQHYEPSTKLVNCLSEYGFAPTISLPTRVTSHSATLIDHIFVNNCTAVTKSGIITEDLSDHLATFVTLLIDPNKLNIRVSNLENTFQHRSILAENLENFKKDVESTDWNFIVGIDSADEKFARFEDKYRELYDTNFPKKSVKKLKRKCDKPWILPWLRSACDRKNHMYRCFIKNNTIEK